jgi:uncharacterized protein (TIGR03435 family)
MKRFRSEFGGRKKLLLRTAGLSAIAVLTVFILAGAKAVRAHSQAQSTATVAPEFKYDVASIKPSKRSGGVFFVGMEDTPDGFTATNFPLKSLIASAYGVQSYEVFGAPGWLGSEEYDIEAKMDGSVVDALLKLSTNDRTLERQHMLQALLLDRLKLTIHHETKELQTYTLVIAKNGPKLQESKPGDTNSNESLGASGGSVGAGVLAMVALGGTEIATGKAVPIANLVRNLTGFLSCPVLDKTGLTGVYDIKLQWTEDNNQTDPNGPSLFTAIQDQLGLKLESRKGPAEVIVIDHVERPSGN